MSAIDRAFIRAYQPDATPVEPARSTGAATVAAPHFRVYEGTPAATPAAEAGAHERRPLSTFTPRTHAVDARFKPALEVDALQWSPASSALVARHAAELRGVVHTLLAADEAGRSLIGVGGAARGAGATTLVACLARSLVEAGKTVAIVDGDFLTAGLSGALGLAVETGWEVVLSGDSSLAESVIQSVGDRLAVLPLVAGGAAAAELLDGIHASVTAGVLRYHYDMVLFDLGAIADPVQGAVARRVARQCRLDGIILTSGATDVALVHPQRLMQAAPELATICMGMVENQLQAA